tara:strand:+ start:1592 stop:1882 length:291 start_codon:yes stop_codon:yes gene_type:complete
MYYGSIFNLRVKKGHEEELTKTFNSNEPKPEGMVAWFVMNPDEKDEWIGVAVFESQDAYIANANRPEQHESFLKMMEHLESEPTWTDGFYVLSEIA